MPRPAASGYERLAQDAELSDSEDDLQSIISHPGRIASALTGGVREPSGYRDGRIGMRRNRSNSSGVDIKAINARLERWAEEIANKFKIGKNKGKLQHEEAALEIVYSVFVPLEGLRPITDLSQVDQVETDDNSRLNKEKFDEIVESVRIAIGKGIDPLLITQGSSGSYFARNTDGKIVGVMKPKDEEPYGQLNPKTTKWLHRNLFPCFFGRSCLIPNLSYISEAAACLLDRQLRTFVVPYTDLVWLSSKAFHYDYWDRRAFYRKKKPLPPKVGSFQAFLQGYEDASKFLRRHPWPDQYNASFRADGIKKKSRRWASTCRPGGNGDDSDDEAPTPLGADTPQNRKFQWTEPVQQQFREELEKLVILDYIMRNTDRGLDNWMIKINWETPNTTSGSSKNDAINSSTSRLKDLNPTERSGSPMYKLHEPMTIGSRSSTPMSGAIPKLTIGAIDNSLAFPWKHPDQWRSFPFGWLFLPVSLIGQPFSTKTREHFLPLLTSPKWWSQTQTLLRQLFEQDSDFKERMFAKQMAVLKGQAFNVVETLKSPDQGPLELTRRTRVHVWDDEMEVPIAVPLRAPSMESRRRADLDPQQDLHEEMDIGASAASSTPLPHDYNLLDFDFSSPAELPSATRFSLSRTTSMNDTSSPRGGGDADIATTNGRTKSVDHGHAGPASTTAQAQAQAQAHRRPERPPHTHKMSYNPPKPDPPPGSRKRTFSIGAGFLSGEDVEGDLGYAAAAGMEKSTRKVIVERLETVKANNPVFSWC